MLTFATVAAGVELRELPPWLAAARAGDHTLISWRDGAPYLTNARPEDLAKSRYSPERRTLWLETGWYSAHLDTARASIAGLQWHAEPRDEAAAESAALEAASLPPARLTLTLRVGDTVYTSSGPRIPSLDTRGMPSVPLEFPVRLIESGRFFQKLALSDLEFRDERGGLLRAAAHLEFAAWPDRFALTLVIRPETPLAAASAEIRLETADGRIVHLRDPVAAWERGREHRCTLAMSAPGEAVPPEPPEAVTIAVAARDPRGRAVVSWNAGERCHEVTLHAPPWPAGTGAYPESMLDAFDVCDVVVENATATAQVVPLKFVHTAFGGITGCVPMLLDAHGRPLGLPVQISKNWHRPREGPAPPFSGTWLHGRSWLVAPAGARLRLQYATTYARWGGVPAASLAQLSLVGWGHNGFWDQLALGSFGESICFQPLRVQRRALITDVRPLHQLGMARGDPHAWTSNVGGADVFVRHDPAGRYVPFKRNVTRYVSHGPNLAHLQYAEVADDEAVSGAVDLWLPRTDDLLRVYLRIRYDVRKPFRFSRLVLFQVGADFYNSGEATRIAVGDAAGLAHEWPLEPAPAPLPGWEAGRAAAWVSLHGQRRDDLARIGQATRGLIVREWKARVDGRELSAPWWAAGRGFAPNRPLGAELILPPGVSALRAGDYVEALLEWVVLPLSAERYYGPDAGLRAALAEGANTWRPVLREARGNRPVLVMAEGRRIEGFPLTLAPGSAPEVAFALAGGRGWIPVRFAGLRAPDTLELLVPAEGRLEPVGQGPAGRAFWQAGPDGRGWCLTYNLPASPQPTHYVVRQRTVTPAATPLRR